MIAIVFALNEELKPILKKSKELPALLRQTGPGMENARRGCERLIEQFHPELILSTGYAGGLKKGLASGELILPTEIRNEAGDLFVPDATLTGRLAKLIEEEKITCHRGPLLTASRPIETPEEKKSAGTQGALAVDLESAAVAAVCERNGIPFASLRVIFDPVDMAFPGLDPPTVVKKAFFKLPRIVRMHFSCRRNLARILRRFVHTTGFDGTVREIS